VTAIHQRLVAVYRDCAINCLTMITKEKSTYCRTHIFSVAFTL